jgi:hypothetical protein
MLSCLTARHAGAPRTTPDLFGRPSLRPNPAVGRFPLPSKDTTIRSTQMLLLNEALARADHARRLDEAQASRTRRRLLAEARSHRRQELSAGR